jgi:hypothetical protein
LMGRVFSQMGLPQRRGQGSEDRVQRTDGDENSLLLWVQRYPWSSFPIERSNEYVQFTGVCRLGLP